MSFFDSLSPGAILGTIFGGGDEAAAETHTCAPPAPERAAAAAPAGPATAATAGVFDGMYDGRPSSSEPWRGVPWMTPEQIGADDERMRKLVEGVGRERPPLMPPIGPPPPAPRDTIGQGNPGDVEASQREAMAARAARKPAFTLTTESGRVLNPVEDGYVVPEPAPRTALERIERSGRGVNAGWKALNKAGGWLAPGASRGQAAPPIVPLAPSTIPTVDPQHYTLGTTRGE